MMVAASMLNWHQKVPLYPTGRGVKLKRCVLSFVLDRLGSYQTIEKEYIKEVKDNAYETHGHYDLVKHELVENKIRLKWKQFM